MSTGGNVLQYQQAATLCEGELSPIDWRSPDLELMEREALEQAKRDEERLGDASAAFLSWLFRGGTGQVDPSDVMRRFFLVVRFGKPSLVERWDSRVMGVLCLPGERWKWARFGLFDPRKEKGFHFSLVRPVRRDVSLGVLCRMGLGDCLHRFAEIETLLDWWFAPPKQGPATPSWVMRNLIVTAWAQRPDLVQGYTQAVLGRLLGQTKGAFSWRTRKMFDTLGIHARLSMRPEASQILSEVQKGHPATRGKDVTAEDLEQEVFV